MAHKLHIAPAVSLILGAAFVLPCMGQTDSKPKADQQIDRLLQSQEIIAFGKKPDHPDDQAYTDSIRQQVAAFYYDQFRHFSDPHSPYFLFLSKDANLAMGIGGAVRMRGYYDWGGAMPSAGFSPYLIPMTPDPASMRHLDATPSGTCLFFRILGRNKFMGNYQINIEANFTGYNV